MKRILLFVCVFLFSGYLFSQEINVTEWKYRINFLTLQGDKVLLVVDVLTPENTVYGRELNFDFKDISNATATDIKNMVNSEVKLIINNEKTEYLLRKRIENITKMEFAVK